MLSTPEDATQQTVLLGRNFTDGMIVTFELEPAKSMWLQLDNPPKWRERTVRKGEIYHLNVKPVTTKFHFKLVGGKVMEVSEPVKEPQKQAELRAEPQ